MRRCSVQRAGLFPLVSFAKCVPFDRPVCRHRLLPLSHCVKPQQPTRCSRPTVERLQSLSVYTSCNIHQTLGRKGFRQLCHCVFFPLTNAPGSRAYTGVMITGLDCDPLGTTAELDASTTKTRWFRNSSPGCANENAGSTRGACVVAFIGMARVFWSLCPRLFSCHAERGGMCCSSEQEVFVVQGVKASCCSVYFPFIRAGHITYLRKETSTDYYADGATTPTHDDKTF